MKKFIKLVFKTPQDWKVVEPFVWFYSLDVNILNKTNPEILWVHSDNSIDGRREADTVIGFIVPGWIQDYQRLQDNYWKAGILSKNKGVLSFSDEAPTVAFKKRKKRTKTGAVRVKHG